MANLKQFRRKIYFTFTKDGVPYSSDFIWKYEANVSFLPVFALSHIEEKIAEYFDVDPGSLVVTNHHLI